MNETETETEQSSPAARQLPKPPKPVALHLIDRDDSEKRARMQLALDEKRAHFLLERAAAASSRRPPDEASRNPETLPGPASSSGKRRSSRSSDGSSPEKRDGGPSAGGIRRVPGGLDGPTDGGPSGKGSRRASGVSGAGVSPFYAAPSRMSNKKLVRNALSTVCLAGGALRLERERALMVSWGGAHGRARLQIFSGIEWELSAENCFVEQSRPGPKFESKWAANVASEKEDSFVLMKQAICWRLKSP